MNRRYALLSISAMLCVVAFSSEDPARLLADTKAFFVTHTVDLSTWPEVDRAYNEAALRKYLDDLGAVFTSKQLHEYRSSHLAGLYLYPIVQMELIDKYLLQQKEVVSNKRRYIEWSGGQESAFVGGMLLSLAKSVGMDEAMEEMKARYGTEEDYLLEIREMLFDRVYTARSAALKKFQATESVWTLSELGYLQGVSYDRQDIQDFLLSYYMERLSADPEKGDLWFRLARYVGGLNAYSGSELRARLLEKAREHLDEGDRYYRGLASEIRRVDHLPNFAEKLVAEGLLVFPSDTAKPADAGNNAIDIAEISEPPVQNATSVVEPAEVPAVITPKPAEIKSETTSSAFPRWGKIAGLLAVAGLAAWGVGKSRGGSSES